LNTELKFTNRLAKETSPYLKQHAHNPVDWYPWSSEAIDAARRLDRPIFLSVGYSACHWCHVMEHESFEDPEVAKLLNENFVAVKVDREERPDLDQIYMSAVQLLTGQGGWPMSIFLTPQLQPFYGGTYFPPDDRYGRPSFKRVLSAVVEAWRTKRHEVTRSSEEITENLRRAGRISNSQGELDLSLLSSGVAMLCRAVDRSYGGFGSAPKFPHATECRLLLRGWKRFGDEDALHVVRLSLDHMAMGGIYDHLGGGFHRYSTDQRWLVPHFEKMLYDNALLSMTYLEAFQATGDQAYREVVEEILDYVRREMTDPCGAFYSTQDADSEGEEGKSFVWSGNEIEHALGEELADLFEDVYGVTAEGNWEGRNILHRTKTYAQHAALRHTDEAMLRSRMKEARRILLEIRSKRVPPGRDEKVLTAWNALMIDSFAQASLPLQEPSYAETAAKAAEFILERMRGSNGRLWRTWSNGSEPKLNAYLEDYSFLINALVSLYETTFEPSWIQAAIDLAKPMIDDFWDAQEGGFFYTGRDDENLILRTKDPHDSSIPSGNSMAATALLRLSKLTGRQEFLDKAVATLRLFRDLMATSPLAAAQMLIALDYYFGPVQEFAVVGDPSAQDARKVLQLIGRGFRPNKIIAFKLADNTDPRLEELIPILAGKQSTGQATTYICRDYACQAPLIGEHALREALESS
jgi:uncharacterized protein YyaL (SSP411 family)